MKTIESLIGLKTKNLHVISIENNKANIVYLYKKYTVFLHKMQLQELKEKKGD